MCVLAACVCVPGRGTHTLSFFARNVLFEKLSARIFLREKVDKRDAKIILDVKVSCAKLHDAISHMNQTLPSF